MQFLWTYWLQLEHCVGRDWAENNLSHWKQYLAVLIVLWWFLDISNTLSLKADISNCFILDNFWNLSLKKCSVNHTAAVDLSGIFAAPWTCTSLVVCLKWTQTVPREERSDPLKVKENLVKSGTPALSVDWRISVQLT